MHLAGEIVAGMVASGGIAYGLGSLQKAGWTITHGPLKLEVEDIFKFLFTVRKTSSFDNKGLPQAVTKGFFSFLENISFITTSWFLIL